jgi:single-strand DNA-binding protein
MNSFEIQGEIAFIGDITRVSDKFTKREIWIKVTDGNFETKINFQLHQEKVSIIEDEWLSVGDKVKVSFNIAGKEWKDTIFNTLKVWRIVKC